MVLQRLLEVCAHLLDLNNFCSVWEVCSGLQGAAVRRLSEMWNKLPDANQATWKRMQELMDSTSNFKKYRARLAEVPNVPCIPYMGFYLTDLVFTEEGLRTYVAGERINVGKFVLLSSTVNEVMRRQRVRYSLKAVDAFQSYFQRLEPLSEEALFAKSLQCQPREK